MKLLAPLLLAFVFASGIVSGQQPGSIQSDFIKGATTKLQKFTERRKLASAKYLQKFKKREERFLRRLCKKDPQKADALYRSAAQSQQRLNKKLSGQYKNPFEKTSTVYNPYDDSLLNAVGYSGDMASVKAAGAYRDELKNEACVKDYMRSEKLSMKKIAVDIPEMRGAFKGVDKGAYYYMQQLHDYDEWFSKTDKWEELGMNALKGNADFSKFMNTNSRLASFPKVPSGWQQSAEGLQTTKMVKELQQGDWNNLTDEGKTMAKDKLTDGAYQIFKLKTELPQLSNAADIPDFKPNPLKTKRLVDRMHYGFDFQFDNRASFIPKGITVSLSGEYDLLPKMAIGLGGGYHAPFKKVKSESKDLPAAVTLRSYIDYQIKSILFFTVDYDRTYPASGKNIESAMAGLKLKYSNNEKLSPSFSLMYDLLFDQHNPKTQMIVYRIGWGIK
jgi:hypothetical protein